MKLKSAVPAVLVAASLLLAGCASGADTAGSGSAERIEFQAKDPVTIGYSVFDLTEPYFQAYAAGVKAGAAQEGIEVLIADSKSSPQLQVSGSADLINQGISALVVSPIQPSALPATISAAHQAKIPVVVGDVGVEGDYDAYILSDNADGGRQAADYFRSAFKDRSGEQKIGVIGLAPGVVVGEERIDSFEAALDGDPNFDVVSKLTGQTVDGAFKAAQDMLNANPDLAGIYAVNSNNVQGAVRAIKSAGREGQVKVVGFNGDPVELPMIAGGEESATVAQDPYGQGKLAVKTALELLNGQNPAYTDPATRTLRFPVEIVDADNLDAYREKLTSEQQ
ncbi:substrate-binding domain-containing protein [Rhodococcus sp. T2V]|uniref:substrate-binding domain-containing protein n=1 Tax=Rhodococcus sp. T2V TaxID=3034164 RepID=UPI0023E2608D|nr:substrate-binding domain-containing protein [Rhodococcus sp. T2V]MDF3310631.1 substrate-binding domain-containing protein [Rhodococcus sp. T2V]